MVENKSGYRLGIIAYGSLITEPGVELEQHISEKIACVTPFKIEYARISSTRSNAPTLIPHKNGGAVQAIILVLDDNISIEEAKSMLWRRETRNSNGVYKHKNVPTVNTVVIETIEKWNGFDTVLYTSIGSNIKGDITAGKLSKYAVNSILSSAGREKKDGIRYLQNAINAGILTPLTHVFTLGILEATQTNSLDDAVAIMDNKRILQAFDKYLKPHVPNHVAIASSINAAGTFRDKVEIYAREYGLLSSRGRIYSKDAQGNESEKIICTCSTCKKYKDFNANFSEYEKLLKEEFDELSNMVHSSLPYSTKLKIWDAIFDGHPLLSYEFYGQKYRLQLDTKDAAEIEQENRFNYQKLLKSYYLHPTTILKYKGKDFESRRDEYISKYNSALYPNELKNKAISMVRDNHDSLRDQKAGLFFERLIDGEQIDFSTRVFEYEDIFSLVAATEDYNFLKFVEQYSIQNPQLPSNVAIVEKTVLPIHFEDRSGREFERLAYAFLMGQKQWKNLEWLGESGDDGGRDIWGEFGTESYCYQCANYRNLPLVKVSEDIDKLVCQNHIPQNYTVISGGKVGNKTRKAIKKYAQEAGILNTEVWSGAEFEEKIRTLAPKLIERFVQGVEFPKDMTMDHDILTDFSACFDRPAFTTTFQNEVNIPDFEKAITDTIEVMNTGMHRLRDGTIIKTFPSRHKIKDTETKQQMTVIYDKVVQLRNTFIALKKDCEISLCGCGQDDCPVYTLSDNACKVMDNLRNQILSDFSRLLPSFQIRIHH